MGEFKQTNGIYLGKMLTSEGTIGKGKRKGYPFKRWKFSFKPFAESDKQFNMGYFQKVEKEGEQFKFQPLPEMKEGEWYTVTFIEEPGEYQGKAITYKTLFKVKEGKSDLPEHQPQQKQAESLVIVAKDWPNFQKSYNEMMKDDPKKDAMHMLGAYLANYYAEVMNDLIVLCQKNFEQ